MTCMPEGTCRSSRSRGDGARTHHVPASVRLGGRAQPVTCQKNAFERVLATGSGKTGPVTPPDVPPVTIIACACHKGGVGKTTTTMGLTAALVRGGFGPALLVDLDPQGHSTLGLAVSVGDEDRSVRDLLKARDRLGLERVTHHTQVPGLDIVPATIGLEMEAQTLYGRPMRHALLRDALEGAAAALGYRWVVIDCPPSLGSLVENALTAADLVIVPCRMEARALDGLADLVDILKVLRGRTFEAWRILRTLVDSHNKIANAAIEAALRSTYAAWLLETVIPKSEALNKAQIARMDIFSFDERATGAAAYLALAEEVVRWQENESPALN